jgi:hypothetical protein
MSDWKTQPSILHLSQRHLHAAINPLDQLTIRNMQEKRLG